MKRALSRMTLVAMASLALVLAGCSSDAINKLYGVPTKKERRAADDAKCREFGFKPGTEGYGSCRLKLEQIHATKWAGIQAGRKK